MYDSFVDYDEPLLIKMLAYKRFNISVRLSKPAKLDVLYLNRNDARRGIVNANMLLDTIRNYTDIQLIIQENKPMSFADQVLNVIKKDMYISIHGAAMTHILFMEPFSAVIELNPPNFKEPFYKNMAMKAQLFFYGVYKTFTDNMKYSMTVRQTDKKLNQFFTVPLELFQHAFSLAVKDVWEFKYQMVVL